MLRTPFRPALWGVCAVSRLSTWVVGSGLVLPTATSLSLQMLARLLKSSHPEDLRAANKLIKEMVQEVMARVEVGRGRRDGVWSSACVHTMAYSGPAKS